MAKVRHIQVGEGLDSTEWAGDETHELVDGGIIVSSKPPSGFHKIYNFYAKKVGVKYQLIMVVETEPEE